MTRQGLGRVAQAAAAGLVLSVIVASAEAAVWRVDRVDPGGVAARAGLQPGDMLSGKARVEGEEVVFADAFGLFWLENEARSLTFLEKVRGGIQVDVELVPGEWGLTVLPWLPRSVLDDLALARAGGRFDALAWVQVEENQTAGSATWLALEAFALALERGDLPAAVSARRRADRYSAAGDAELRLAAALRVAELLSEARRFEEAIAAFSEVVALPDEGGDRHRLGAALAMAGRAEVLDRAGDLEGALADLESALVIAVELLPAGPLEAELLAASASLLDLMGRPQQAEVRLTSAVEILTGIDPGAMALARVYSGLGILAEGRSELAAAEGHHRRSLAIHRELAPGGLGEAVGLMNLGVLAEYRQDLDQAELLYRQSLAIREELEPKGRAIAGINSHIGNVAFLRGDLEVAERSYSTAMEMREELAPKSLGVVVSHLRFASLLEAKERPGQAAEHLAMALELCREIAPRSLNLSAALISLAGLRWRSEPEEAIKLLAEAAEVESQAAPGGEGEAQIHWLRGRIHLAAGEKNKAQSELLAAVEVVEGLRVRLGGGRAAGARFSERFAELYRELILLLVELGRPEAAFELSERYRARGLVEMIAERAVRVRHDGSSEAVADLHRLAAALDRAESDLHWAAEGDLDRLAGEVRDLRGLWGRALDDLRVASPRVAALHDPRPIGIEDVAKLLGESESHWSWVVGEDATARFVVDRGGVEAVVLDVGRERLERLVRSLGSALEGATGRARLEEVRRQLGEALVGDRDPGVGARLVALDGPLHRLPLALLETRTWSDGGPIVRVPSLTVLAEIRGRPRSSAEQVLVALGDPDYGAGAAGTLRAGLTALPATRVEVEALCALFPERSTCHLGAAANQAALVDLGTVRYLHFACHGFVDDVFPLASSLVLSERDDDGGLLHAWKILETLELDAEMVTLSACETALGSERGGEGPVGLSNAFLHAGARSVLASLWQVRDEATARFMVAFYGRLAAGSNPAVALHETRRQFQGEGPSVWAAFVLIGDSRPDP